MLIFLQDDGQIVRELKVGSGADSLECIILSVFSLNQILITFLSIWNYLISLFFCWFAYSIIHPFYIIIFFNCLNRTNLICSEQPPDTRWVWKPETSSGRELTRMCTSCWSETKERVENCPWNRVRQEGTNSNVHKQMFSIWRCRILASSKNYSLDMTAQVTLWLTCSLHFFHSDF